MFIKNAENPDVILYIVPRNGGNSFPAKISEKPWDSRLVRKEVGGSTFTVASGKYQVLLSVLKPFGDPNNKHDFMTWRSPILNIIDSTAAATTSEPYQTATPTA